MSNPLLFVNFGSSSADTCFNDTFTDNYVSNCRILQYITTIRPDRPSHIIGWPPYLRHAEGAHPNMVSYRELGQNPETLVVYTRNHPQGQNSNYFLRLQRRIQVRSRSNPSSVNLLFSLLTQCFRISKMIPISTTTDCWRKEKFTTDLKKVSDNWSYTNKGEIFSADSGSPFCRWFCEKISWTTKIGESLRRRTEILIA